MGDKNQPAQLIHMKQIQDDSDHITTDDVDVTIGDAAVPTGDTLSNQSHENLGYDNEGENGTPPPYNWSGTNGVMQTTANSNRPVSLSPEGKANVRSRHASSTSERSEEEKASMRKRHISSTSVSSLTFDDAVLDENINLVYSKHEHIPSKDFSKEVRGAMDVQKYLKNMVLLMDLHHTSPDGIINAMLHKMLDTTENVVSYDQARSALFTHDQVHQLSKTVQCASFQDGLIDYEQNWIISMASIPSLQTRHVGITRLKHGANLGWTCQEVLFVIIILAPTKEKSTKSDLETARTFATIFSDIDFRQQLYDASSEEEFRQALVERTSDLGQKVSPPNDPEQKLPMDEEALTKKNSCSCQIGRGLKEDLQRRLPHYWADYKDGVVGPKSIQKTISATLFLYFACMLPSIAFGVLNDNNTNTALNVEKVFYSQFIGGLFFAIFGGTPQIVLLTTAPLALYTKIIFSICEDFDLNFSAMFCMVGLWNTFFLIIYSVFGLSVLMKFSTRSSEEIFALFISIAFSVDAFKNLAHNFGDHYCENSLNVTFNVTQGNVASATDCDRSISLLYLFLLFGTLWIGVTLFNFTKTPFLTAGKREILADYALPVSVVIMSFFGAFVFKDIKAEQSGFNYGLTGENALFKLVPFETLSVGAVFGAMGLGFCLSLLFFMDQNISAALVNAPQNKMKKGTAYHWDLLVIGLVNGVLSIFNLPWVHAALPHSPLHVRALADVEDRVDQGHIHQIVVRVRETRLTAIFSHVLIALSIFLLPYLQVIPTAVLYGLFLYVAVTALYDNEMFERILLYITEQSAYPPNHYIRRVPQRKMHLFTFTQIVQLAVLCFFGFFPYSYLKMFFPVLIFCLIPVRHKIIPKIIDRKYLEALDGH